MKGKYKAKTQYVLSYYGKILDNSNANNYRIRVYYTDNTYTDGVITGNKYEKRIIKTLNDKTVYKIIGYYGTMNGDFIVKDVMLEEGAEVTQYEEYKGNKKNVLIKEPLRSIDNIKDIMYEDNGQVKAYRKTAQYFFTGNEEIRMEESILKNCLKFVIKVPVSIQNSGEVICNTLLKGHDGMINSIRLASNNQIVIIIEKIKLTTQNEEGLKA